VKKKKIKRETSIFSAECCWQTVGTGQFRSGENVNPNIGSVGELESVEEVRVETLCVGRDVAEKSCSSLEKVGLLNLTRFEFWC